MSLKFWREPVVTDPWAGMAAGRTDLCVFGLRCPDLEWGQGRGPKLSWPSNRHAFDVLVGALCILQIWVPTGLQHLKT